MLRLAVREYDRIPYARIGAGLLRRLRRFDHACSMATGQTVFDWGGIDAIRVQNHVGIVQIPGLVVEILPKLTEVGADTGGADDAEKRLAQKNLLFMLSVAGELPFEERRLADQHVQRMPLIEVLVAAFVRSLVKELRRGIPRDYVSREDNLLFLRGKVLHGPNVRLNASHRERLYARYEEFLPDTHLNRILRATCERLRQLPLGRRTTAMLYEASSVLVDVEDVEVTADLFERVHFNRNTERFLPLLVFCRAVLLSQTPTPGLGRSRTFSLLFPMEQVFEGFIGGLLRRHARELSLMPSQIRLQSAGTARWLVRTEQGAGRFRLKPDVLIEGNDRKVTGILDTKWKRLKTDADDVKNGVLPADMYQLYAYAHRFDSPNNVLLYPAAAGATRKVYHLRESGRLARIRIEFFDLARDLYQARTRLVTDLARVLELNPQPTLVEEPS